MSIGVMLVDDQDVIRDALRSLLDGSEDMSVVAEASSGLEAIEKAPKAHPDVILMDLQMGGMNGLQAARVITDILPMKVVLLTVHYDKNLIKEATRSGISAYLLKTVSRQELLRTIRRVASEKVKPVAVEPNLREKRRELEEILEASMAGAAEAEPEGGLLDKALMSSIVTMVASVEAKDVYTYGHSHKVAELAESMSRSLGLTAEEITEMRMVALVHDVGKIAVPDDILQSDRALSESEWEYMRQHSVSGADILSAAGLPEVVHEAVRFHHERVDGTGYPDGLKGKEIPYMSRVIAVADTFDAITSRRAYRPARSGSEAKKEILRVAGSQLDKEVVDAFLGRAE